jgi:pimeloyl-ACP methyl ester carboxylesterase
MDRRRRAAPVLRRGGHRPAGGAAARIAKASHWVQADAPERVNQLMVEFLQPIGG